MSSTETLSVQEFLSVFEPDFSRNAAPAYGWVDVRSEGEFQTASFPGFKNLPILNDSERHEVGLTYKQKGQAEAIQLGHRLVDPSKPGRVRSWIETLQGSSTGEGVMICWRGGMRSQIAAQWSREAGARVRTVEGGFKAVRNELLKSFSEIQKQLPKIIIVSGLTGSGKTELLKRVRFQKIDLEKLANHRGSSFGRKINGRQPAQATFENLLALEIRRCQRKNLAPSPAVLLEDESVSIGSCFLHRELKLQMNRAPCIWVDSAPEERARRIFEEYILEPLQEGVNPKDIFEWMLASLSRIERKLGGLETSKVYRLLEEAFHKSSEHGFQPGFHDEWITRLLETYYDPMYRYGFKKNSEAGREILFQGGMNECQEWLEKGAKSHERN